MQCKICDSPSTEYHFGISSCRACAAFFRRYVNSPKQQKECNCEMDRPPCRYCRMEMCVKAGMMVSKVQQKRDSNPCRASGSSLETTQIALRNSDRIFKALGNYNVLGQERKIVHKTSPAKKVNFFEYTSIAIIDSRMVWKLLENTLIELQVLDEKDKHNLFSNFYPKWTLFESAIMAFQRSDVHTFFAPNGKPAKQISKFYKDCMTSRLRMKDDEVLKIFEPYWNSYYGHVAYPLFDLKFDYMELMAILTLLLMDPGYTNISDECSEMCHSLRKVIQRELKGYYLEKNLPTERLFKIIEALLLMEKADTWLQEEVHMCGIYNVPVDEEFRRMVMAPKL
ncbi:CRE-NHR-161 protein [Caenorhabditis remanei]|uniref:CRE-NHR-161 protein n=1 Tax=Caenorhabditis remanei TaxID=31234 RepID=E3LPI8_CAERE|nr:CRE-NHR-161 protein [Caenorhabditis remanei]